MEIKNYTVDGLRHIEKITTSNNETFVEHYEEVVPMKLTKKVSVKTVQVPVEEKTEVFNEDGTVDTNIKSIPMDTYNLVESTPKMTKIVELPVVDDEPTVDKTIPIQSLPEIIVDKKDLLMQVLWVAVTIIIAILVYSRFPL